MNTKLLNNEQSMLIIETGKNKIISMYQPTTEFNSKTQ
jgi:hypothetical protein